MIACDGGRLLERPILAHPRSEDRRTRKSDCRPHVVRCTARTRRIVVGAGASPVWLISDTGKSEIQSPIARQADAARSVPARSRHKRAAKLSTGAFDAEVETEGRRHPPHSAGAPPVLSQITSVRTTCRIPYRSRRRRCRSPPGRPGRSLKVATAIALLST
jgi:hypothetical protein